VSHAIISALNQAGSAEITAQETAEIQQIVLSPEEIRFVIPVPTTTASAEAEASSPSSPEPLASVDKVKTLGEFPIEIRVKGGSVVKVVKRVLNVVAPPSRL